MHTHTLTLRHTHAHTHTQMPAFPAAEPFFEVGFLASAWLLFRINTLEGFHRPGWLPVCAAL